MGDAVTPEELLGSSTEPLDVDLRCVGCGTDATVRVSWATIDPRVSRGSADGWDGVALSQIFTCTSCGAVDEYEVGEASYRQLTREMNRASGSRVIRGVSRLWDGTEARRPAAALARLRALAAERPTNAEAWRRLGNFCERYELHDESMAAWRKAVDVGPDEFEAAYGLAAQLFADAVEEITDEAVGFLRTALSRFASTNACSPGRRPSFAEALATLLFQLADASDVPIVLLASWAADTGGGTVVVTVSSAELARLDRRTRWATSSRERTCSPSTSSRSVRATSPRTSSCSSMPRTMTRGRRSSSTCERRASLPCPFGWPLGPVATILVRAGAARSTRGATGGEPPFTSAIPVCTSRRSRCARRRS